MDEHWMLLQLKSVLSLEDEFEVLPHVRWTAQYDNMQLLEGEVIGRPAGETPPVGYLARKVTSCFVAMDQSRADDGRVPQF